MSNPLESLLSNFGDGLKGQVVTMTIGEIVEMDRSLNRAAKVVLKSEPSIGIDSDEYLYNVPIATFNTADYVLLTPYKAGDSVTVVFSHRDLDNILANEGGDAKNQSFSKSNAVIVGGANLFTQKIVGDWDDDDIVLAKRDGTSSIVIKSNNDIQVNTNGNIYLGDKGSTEGVPLGKQLKQWLDGHTHDYSWTSDGGNSTTSPVSNKSPEPSERVFTV